MTPAIVAIITCLGLHHECFPDAARRLIYITDLNPACIHALAATTSNDQTPVLRNAIYKHLTFQTSIVVKVPSAGFLTFQLDLHLPFFLLRKSMPAEESVRKINTKPRRRWTNLSFLGMEGSRPQEMGPVEAWGMQDAQISFVIFGFDEQSWVGYGFVDAEIDSFLTDSTLEDLSFDQIVAGNLDANLPIWKPREY